ncbi:putative glycolipid-binding domain-containing protein [Luteimonas sp. SJ-92]|uniref:Putative glycolipid-binding domain-containing protein n=1 Tax=Luteimonas salinisoli TaxID=2752307 RepID=A0A853JC94_9GAMM|nr:putative glycolipid-binding domain-containing protein [Luteimonas salinisoli]NZA26465.1 putative glycolipid-binding domain-containing protein [Luteimonas salinisoli]
MSARFQTRKWRRLDEPGLEVLHVRLEPDGILACSTVVHAGAEAFGMSYLWRLDRDWRTRRLELRLSGPSAETLRIERCDGSWQVNGRRRPDLAECEEIDLSATPFCNTLALRRLRGTGELTTLYVDLPSLQLSPSRQRYTALGGNRWKYTDLGIAKGFEANLDVDDEGLILAYEGLFETLE